MRLSSKITIVWLALAIAPAAIAQQEQGSGHAGHAGMGDMPGMGETAEPEHGGSAWAELKETRDAIAKLIESGKLAEVHNQAERLAPLGEALKAGAKSVPDDKRIRIEATLRQLGELGKTLDKAGDSGDVAATSRELKRFDGVISLIQAPVSRRAPFQGAGSREQARGARPLGRGALGPRARRSRARDPAAGRRRRCTEGDDSRQGQ